MRLGPAEPLKLPWWSLLGILAAYAGVVVVLQQLSGIPYDDIANSTSNLVALAGIVAVGALLLAVITTALGWWPAVLRDDLPVRRWLMWSPGLLLAAALVVINVGAFAGLGWRYLAAAAVTMLLVGFAEELMCRGLLLVGFRELTTERWAWFFSTLVFGGMHVLNVLSGRPIGVSIIQAIAAFGTGTALYLARRASGTIIVPMLLHALWDFSLFTQVGARAQGLGLNVAQLLVWLVLVVAGTIVTIVAMVALWRGADGEAEISEGTAGSDAAA